jgi:hypothetical protein
MLDKRNWIGIIVQLNQGLTLALFKNRIKIICVGACDELFRLVLNSRHSNDTYKVIYTLNSVVEPRLATHLIEWQNDLN